MNAKKNYNIPLQPIIGVEIFYRWGIDFIGPFIISNRYENILMVVEYVSRWTEAIQQELMIINSP